jgi:hypothetical protein
MHDSTIADYTGVYDKLERVFETTGGKVIVDSASKLKIILSLFALSKHWLGQRVEVCSNGIQ